MPSIAVDIMDVLELSGRTFELTRWRDFIQVSPDLVMLRNPLPRLASNGTMKVGPTN